MLRLEGVSHIFKLPEEPVKTTQEVVQLLFLKGNWGKFPPPQETTEWVPPQPLQGMKTFTILRKHCRENRTI